MCGNRTVSAHVPAREEFPSLHTPQPHEALHVHAAALFGAFTRDLRQNAELKSLFETIISHMRIQSTMREKRKRVQ